MTETKKARVSGKVYFTGNLVFKDSFVSVASGIGNESTDSMVYRDSEGRLIIPAASFAGVLRDNLERLFEQEKKELDFLFGNNKNDEEKKCSDIVFTDLYADGEENAVVQQGVRISRKYLAAEHQGKFDREITLNQKFPFYFYIEKTRTDEVFYQKWLKRLAAVFNHKNIFFVGGRNSVGNGWAQFHDVKYLDYDFSQPGKLKNFLIRKGMERDFVEAEMTLDGHSLPGEEAVQGERYFIQLEYGITFKDAFLINDPDAEPDEDEAEFNFLTLNGKYTIPGSSVKGVFRSRSEMIVKTIGSDPEKIKEVFGNTDKKSKIYFSYAFQDENKTDEITKKLMDGVSIDRFTGGAVEAALFDFKLLMNATFKGRIMIEVTKDNIWYLPILYLVIRDIREGDLSFGFGRTKGWGRAASFDIDIKDKNLPDDWAKLVSGTDFNLDALDNFYKTVLGEER